MKKQLIDAHDVVAGVGAALITTGLWRIHPPTALIALGALLVAAAVYGARR